MTSDGLGKMFEGDFAEICLYIISIIDNMKEYAEFPLIRKVNFKLIDQISEEYIKNLFIMGRGCDGV